MALIFERGTPWEQTESAWLNFFKFLLRSVCTRLILKLSTYILKLSTYWYHPLIPEFWKLPLKEIGVLKYYLLIRSCISTANNFLTPHSAGVPRDAPQDKVNERMGSWEGCAQPLQRKTKQRRNREGRQHGRNPGKRRRNLVWNCVIRMTLNQVNYNFVISYYS